MSDVRASEEKPMGEQGDKLTCMVCGAKGIGIGFKHDCSLILAVGPNDDPELSCFLCRGQEHIPRPLCTSFYTPTGRTCWGLHRHCYDRALLKTAERTAT
jgi:hypothetical protein